MKSIRLLALLLFASSGLFAQAGNPDIGIVQFIYPANNYNTCASSVYPVVMLYNYSSYAPITSALIYYQVDGGPVTTYNWTGNLLPAHIDSVHIGPVIAAAGAHIITCMSSMPNGLQDPYAGNDTARVNYVAVPLAIMPLPLLETFEAWNYPPSGWTQVFGNTGYYWQRNNYLTTGPHYALADHFTNPVLHDVYVLTSPPLDFMAQANYYLVFDVAYARRGPGFNDSLKIDVSTDCGNTWSSPVYQKTDLALATAPDNPNAFTPTSAQWRSDTVNLQAFAGNQDIQIRFNSINGRGNNLYIDNVYVYNDLPPIASFTASPDAACDQATVQLTRTSQHSTTFQWSMPGGTPATSALANPVVNYSSPGTYPVTLVETNAIGADSMTTNIVVAAHPTPSLTASGLLLYTEPYYINYEWRKNGHNIMGANNSSYMVTEDGSYYVSVIDTNHCTGWTITYNFINVGVSAIFNDAGIQLMPNPANDFVEIKMQEATHERTTISIINAIGAMVHATSVQGNSVKINTSNLAAGIYLVQLKRNGAVINKKLVINR